MHDGEETQNLDYQFFEYKVFDACDQDRLMSWKDGGEWIILNGSLKQTKVGTTDEVLTKGTSVAVVKTDFKLVYRGPPQP
ncbi:hypothetical protein BKA56DRAFT_596450 [Ilyonectria sp. MPI-CAGE-AT-0026]|nr:hypothetical protein BKA56DRAFT_596450 [Ilyonectria sp. MPI-CAGE-AT-0026]